MTEREQNDLLFKEIMKQCQEINELIRSINKNLKQAENELFMAMAENIANRRLS